MSEALLEVSHLVTEFDTDEGVVRAIDDVSFSALAGETLGIVGESGCGKSVTALSIMRLLPQPMGKITDGEVLFKGRDLTQLPLTEMQKIRGADISMVFQEPMTALNPVHTNWPTNHRSVAAASKLHSTTSHSGSGENPRQSGHSLSRYSHG